MCVSTGKVGEKMGGKVVKNNSYLQTSVQQLRFSLPVALLRDPGGRRHHATCPPNPWWAVILVMASPY